MLKIINTAARPIHQKKIGIESDLKKRFAAYTKSIVSKNKFPQRG
jgi:hypothetical protein